MICGGEDFVSSIFNNTLAVTAFPSLQQSADVGNGERGAFYLTLQKVRANRAPTSPGCTSRTTLQYHREYRPLLQTGFDVMRDLAFQKCFGRLQREECPAFASGPEATYMLKLMLLKMAHKDWTAIDRQIIVSKAKRLRALMPAVVHHSCEAAVSTDGTAVGAVPIALGVRPRGNRSCTAHSSWK